MRKVKKYSLAILFVVSLIGLIWSGLHLPLPSQNTPLRYYSQHHSHKLLILKAIDSAQDSIDLSIFSLTDTDLIAHLNAKASKVPIHIHYDPKHSAKLTQAMHPSIKLTPKSGVKLMHRKILIIDRKLTLIGSTNMTKPSLIFHKNEMVGLYSAEIATWLAENLAEKNRSQHFTLNSHSIAIYLLPHNNALNALLKVIDQAHTQIEGQLFCLNHPQIIQSLQSAQSRGVNIHFTLDKGQGNQKRNEFPITYSKGYELLHSKSCQIDTTKIIGSVNWTRSGFKKNGEILLIIDSK